MAVIGGISGGGSSWLPPMGNYWDQKRGSRPVDLNQLKQALLFPAGPDRAYLVAQAFHVPVRHINGVPTVLDGGGVPVDLGKLLASMISEGVIPPPHRGPYI